MFLGSQSGAICTHACTYMQKSCKSRLRFIVGHELREGDSIIIYSPNFNTSENEKALINTGAIVNDRCKGDGPGTEDMCHLSLGWRLQLSPEGKVSFLNPYSQACPFFPPPAFEFFFFFFFCIEEFGFSRVRNCLLPCVFSDSFALGHRHVTLIYPPDTVTRNLAWKLVTWRSRVSVELLMFCFLFYFLKFSWLCHMACGILVSQTEDPTCVPCSGSVRINHWTTGEVPELPMISRCSKDGGCTVGPGTPGQSGQSWLRSRLSASQPPSLVPWRFCESEYFIIKELLLELNVKPPWGTVRAHWSQLTAFGELGLGFPDAGPGQQALRVSGGRCQGKP